MLRVAAWASLALLASCSTPTSRIKKAPERFQSYPETARAEIQSGKIAPGFTEEMVRMALGAPDRVYRRRWTGGEALMWAYTVTSFDFAQVVLSPSLAVVGGSSTGHVRLERPEEKLRVAFEDGKVVSIETREK